jgi:hypothetical protein
MLRGNSAPVPETTNQKRSLTPVVPAGPAVDLTTPGNGDGNQVFLGEEEISDGVVQKERSCQPEFFFRGLPLLRCNTHWRGSSTTLQLALSCAMSRFEGCASEEGIGEGGSAGRTISTESRTPCFDRMSPSQMSLAHSARRRIRSDISQFPFRFNPGTIEENVGMSSDVLRES